MTLSTHSQELEGPEALISLTRNNFRGMHMITGFPPKSGQRVYSSKVREDIRGAGN